MVDRVRSLLLCVIVALGEVDWGYECCDVVGLESSSQLRCRKEIILRVVLEYVRESGLHVMSVVWMRQTRKVNPGAEGGCVEVKERGGSY